MPFGRHWECKQNQCVSSRPGERALGHKLYSPNSYVHLNNMSKVHMNVDVRWMRRCPKLYPHTQHTLSTHSQRWDEHLTVMTD